MRERLEGDAQAEVEGVGDAPEGLDAGLVLAALDARDGRVAGADAAGEVFLRQAVARAVEDDLGGDGGVVGEAGAFGAEGGVPGGAEVKVLCGGGADWMCVGGRRAGTRQLSKFDK